jgi:hypothetical protein
MENIPTRQSKNSIPEVNVNNTSASDRLLSFVNEQIDRMRKYTQLGNGQPTFLELNTVLSNYSSINCSFIALDVMAKEEYQKAKDAFDEFMADKYIEARSILNPPSLSAQKWSSQKEIEYYIQHTWPFEYRALRDEMNATEKKVAFTRRLLDNLSDLKFNIGVLSKNVQAEVLNLSGARALGLEQN